MQIPIIDKSLNSITMYRLVMYGLIVLAVIAIGLGFLHKLPFSGLQFIETLLIVTITCFVTNFGISKLLKVATGDESYLITGLILFFILAPIANLTDVWVTVAAGVIAMASKYVLVINKKHVFNPAAIAIFLLSLFGIGNGIWWVGSLILLPFVLILGLLVVRKIRRFHLFISFVISAVTVLVLFNLGNHMSPMESMKQSFTSWPLIFFGTIMLTEPLTAPARKNMQIIYGALVGVLFGAQFHIGLLNSSPEFALVVGNIFAYLVSSKQKLFLKLKSRREIGKDLYEFVFEKTNVFSYIPGQYMEWTLAGFRSDFRGNRRYFTIASSPTEQDIKLGVKITPDHASAFKKQLLKISPGFPMVADHLAGDFVLPEEN
jgi:Na+-translocating ferredoxin:NAD+ oxidoreductase RnfD subunit